MSNVREKRSSFHSPKLYPEFARLQSYVDEIRGEALGARKSMTDIVDNRAALGAWQMLPLLAEEEDHTVFPEAICRHNCRLVPRTVELLSTIPDLVAYAISTLEPAGHIQPHHHRNPYVTASLCLQSGGDAHLVVDGERRDYRDGELVIFDYTLQHEVVNNGKQARIVLLMLLESRCC